MSGRRAIGEVEGETSGDEVRRRSEVRHVTGIPLDDGYNRTAPNATAWELYGQANRHLGEKGGVRGESA